MRLKRLDSLLLRCPLARNLRVGGLGKLLLVLALGGAFFGAPVAPAAALEIGYSVEDLADLDPAEDLWRYRYTVTGDPLEAAQGFAVLFDPADVAELLAPPALGPEWDPIAIQPDPALPDFGLYDVLALVDAPDLAAPFAVDFVWTGAGDPGDQPFVLYDADFTTLLAGSTQPVPEPGPGLLLLAGGALTLALGSRRARARSHRAPRGARRLRPLGLLPLALCLAPTCTPEPVVREAALGELTLRWWLVETVRTGRLEAEYRYTAELENAGTDAAGVVVTVESAAGSTVVRDDLLVFGDVPAGAQLPSRDTFTIAQDRSVAFDPADLTFAAQTEATPDVPDWAGTVGLAGGLLDAQGGSVVLDFPAGSVAAETPIRVTRLDRGVPLEGVVPGTVFDLGPDGALFDPPIRVTLAYDEENLVEGVDEAELQLGKFDGEIFEPLSGSVVDPVANTVSAPLDGFSTVTVVTASITISCDLLRVDGTSFCWPTDDEPSDGEPGGLLDPRFGTAGDGRGVYDLGSSRDRVRDVAVQPDGRIVLAGSSPNLAAARVLADGNALDASFGDQGVARQNVQAASSGQALVIDPFGRIVVAGSSNEPPPETFLDLALVRFLRNGSLDAFFADEGVLLDERGPVQASELLRLPDGRLLVIAPGGLLRYLRDGTPDATFGSDGLVDTPSRSPNAGGVWLADGRVVTVNRVSSVGGDAGELKRWSVEGDLFRTGRLVKPERGLFAFPVAVMETLAGSFVMAGSIAPRFNGERDAFVALFQRSDLENRGAFFGFGDGFQSADFGGSEEIKDALRLDDGRFILVGTTEGPGGDLDFFVTRFRADGLLDPTFGDQGQVLVDFGGDDVAWAVSLDGEGRILVAGETESGNASDAALVRLLP